MVAMSLYQPFLFFLMDISLPCFDLWKTIGIYCMLDCGLDTFKISLKGNMLVCLNDCSMYVYMYIVEFTED